MEKKGTGDDFVPQTDDMDKGKHREGRCGPIHKQENELAQFVSWDLRLRPLTSQVFTALLHCLLLGHTQLWLVRPTTQKCFRSKHVLSLRGAAPDANLGSLFGTGIWYLTCFQNLELRDCLLATWSSLHLMVPCIFTRCWSES